MQPTITTEQVNTTTTPRIVSTDSGGNIVLAKTAGVGLKVDTTTPTYPWRDIEGTVVPRAAAPNQATLNVFRGGAVREWAFAAGDVSDNHFHIPHDYLPGSDLFIHVHWGHNGTTITGNMVFTISYTYAKGHNQAIFPAETVATITYNTVNIATTPQYVHRIDEIQITAASPGAGQIASSLIEPDGMFLVNVAASTIPTITGGSPDQPFIFEIDLHYQSTNIGTKQKAPNFYV